MKKIAILGVLNTIIMPFVLIMLFFILIFAPIAAVAEAVNHAQEQTGQFFESLGNFLLFRGWCSGDECHEKAEKEYYEKVKELYNKYEKDPYKIKLKMHLVQATIFYNLDFDRLFDDAKYIEDGSDIDIENEPPTDYHLAKTQLVDLINHLVYQDSSGVYYQDVNKYDEYLRNHYIRDNYPEVLSYMTVDEVIEDIKRRAGYYEDEQLITDKDEISGDILDLLDAPYRSTECAITSKYGKRGDKVHQAVDVVGKSNKNIYSVYDGVVVAVNTYTENLYKYWDSNRKMCICSGKTCPNGYGTYIIIEHTINGQKYRSRYAHLGSTLVQVGDTVSKGTQIGVEGNTGCSTGSHLHFEFYTIEGHKFDPTSIMDRCMTNSAIVANCNLDNIIVKLTKCTSAWAGPNSQVLEEVPFRDYVKGVFIPEISPASYHMEFMKAFAIAVQTYSLRRGKYDENSNYIYLRNCSNDQNYRSLSTISQTTRARIDEAVDGLFGQVMMKNGKLMSGAYKASEKWGCGYQKNDMCQIGGNNMAKNGSSYKDILEYYYVNPEIVNFCQNTADSIVPGIDNNKPVTSIIGLTDVEKESYNKKLEDKINSAGIGSRAGVVAAARYLAIDFPHKIPYFTGETETKGRYYEKGLNLDSKTGWGVLVTKEGIPTANEIPGESYYNGLDDSGFITWAMLNGGIDTDDIGTEQLLAQGEHVMFGSSAIANDVIKVGDLFFDGVAIGMVIGIDGNNIYVAQSKSSTSGLSVSSFVKTDQTVGYYYVSMNHFYRQDGNISNMW